MFYVLTLRYFKEICLQKIMDSDDDKIFKLIPEDYDSVVSDNISDVRELLPVDSFVDAAASSRDNTQADVTAPDQLPPSSQDSSTQVYSAPPVLRRSSSSAVSAYLRSPTARRIQTKASHCYFCQRMVTKDNLEKHLASSDQCLSLYKRKLKVRSLDSVMSVSFFCLFCNCTRGKLKLHLEQSPGCMESYCHKYQVESIRFVNIIIIEAH